MKSNSVKGRVMRSALKRITVRLYCAGWISFDACKRVFERFDLKRF